MSGKQASNQKAQLVHRMECEVRFSEIDALGIIWHGHYLKYFEDCRESFGNKYGLGYQDIYNHGFAAPLIKLKIDFKKTGKYGDKLIVECTFVDTAASKIIFHYRIFRKEGHELLGTGETTQVFITLDQNLYITLPPFFEEWKKINL